MKLRKGTLASYNPKSGFFLAVIGVPLIIVEVHSEGQARSRGKLGPASPWNIG